MFSRSLYASEAVESAVETYADLAKLGMTMHDDVIELSIEDPDPDVADVLADELANHVLAETIARSKA
jgi:hypothetical protein